MAKVHIIRSQWELKFQCVNCTHIKIVSGVVSGKIIIICKNCKTEYRVTAELKVRKTEAQSNKELGF